MCMKEHFATVALVLFMAAFGHGQTLTQTCHFTTGSLAGQTITLPNAQPTFVGAPCRAGMSFGVAVAPPTNPFTLLDAQLRGQGFNGVVYVSKNGSVQFDRAYGFADMRTHAPNVPASAFLIGSLTKQFTAAAILHLQDQGLLNIGDPVCKYITSCPPQWMPITIKELLNHSSGLADYLQLPQIQMLAAASVTPGQLLALIAPLPLQFQPGSTFDYSNSNYVVLGCIIERISGQTYSAFMDSTFFSPLNLTNTGYAPGGPLNTRGTPPTPVNTSIAFAAGGIFSTASDLGTWVEDLAFGNVLSPTARKAMFNPSIRAPKCNGAMGFGWCVGSMPNGKLMYFHDGDITGYESAITIVPGKHIVVVALSNVQGAPVMTLTDSIAISLSH